MIYMTQMKARNDEGALERILGVIRVRGFAVQAMKAFTSNGGRDLDLTISVTGARSTHQLCRQLEKLYGVEQVEVYVPVEEAEIGVQAASV